MTTIIEGYLARDSFGLFIYSDKPERTRDGWFSKSSFILISEEDEKELPKELADIKWEDKPIKIKLFTSIEIHKIKYNASIHNSKI